MKICYRFAHVVDDFCQVVKEVMAEEHSSLLALEVERGMAEEVGRATTKVATQQGV